MNRLPLCLSIVGLALTACGSEPDPDAAAATTPQSAAKAASADPMARMARAVGNGKPGAAVVIRYDFSAKPAVGTPTELQIAFIPQVGVDALDIVVSVATLVIHWGTVTGLLAATVAGMVCSLCTTSARWLFGWRAGRFYYPGIFDLTERILAQRRIQ